MAKAKERKTKIVKKTTKPKPKAISTKNLDDGQRTFIKAKVKELGDMEAVKKFYRREDAVSTFANKEAKKIFKVKNKKVALGRSK